MKVSDKGVAELLSHEAMVTSPYRDSVGVWTVGVGHTSSAGKPNPQTMAKAVEAPLGELVDLFRRDLSIYETDVNNAVKVPLKQHEFDALVSFHFNTGAIARASLVKKLNAGDRMGAAEGLLEWKKPAEIIERRRKEMKLFRDGRYSNDGKCTIYPADRNGRVQWGSGRRVSVASLVAPSDTTTIPQTSTGHEIVAMAVTLQSASSPIKVVATGPAPAVIVSDGPIAKPGFWARFVSAFNKRTGA